MDSSTLEVNEKKERREHLEQNSAAVTEHVHFEQPREVARSVHNHEEARDAPRYRGEGTKESPFVVEWDIGDPEDPYNWPKSRKWPLTLLIASSTLCVSFSSSSYSGGLSFMADELHISQTVADLGISLYVLGFGIGPLVFAPLSELYGRRVVFMCTYAPYTLFHMAGAFAQNGTTILICRLLTGILGSSPLTNAGGAIADMWNARERGVATALYSTAPYLGPVIGPIVGGFVAENPRTGWRFNFWIMMIFSGLIYFNAVLFMPETYAPELLRRRARRLRHEAGEDKTYISKYDLTRNRSFKHIFTVDMSRPFIFLLKEPIVTLLAVYISITYAILYALFDAYPIVFQQHHHFTPGKGGLAFLGVGVGIVIGTSLSPLQNKLYWSAMDRSPSGRAPPEERLYNAMVGAILLPLGLFWFAWTSQPPISPFVPIAAGLPFGTGFALILQSLTAYIMDAYSIYAASALAATVVLRSLMACAFPLFSPPMFANLEDEWAMSIFAFLALACMPMPAMFYKFGSRIRDRSKFAVKDGHQELPSAIHTPATGIPNDKHSNTLV